MTATHRLRTRAPIPPGRPGFTLVETVVVLAITTILLVAIGSAIALAARAVPASNSPTQAATAANRGVAPVLDELPYALSFSERTAWCVQFTVADRTGDGAPETIRYAWSGLPGEPLTRQFNAGTPFNVLDSVHDLNFTYDIFPVATTQWQTVSVLDAETLLASFDGWPGYAATSLTRFVSGSAWTAQYVQCTPPPDATGLTITKVRLNLKRTTGAPAGNYSVGLHHVASLIDMLPRATPIGTPVTRTVASLSTVDGFKDYTFTDVVITNPSGKLCLFVKGACAGGQMNVNYYSNPNAPANSTCMHWTDNGGSNWSPAAAAFNNADTRFYLYGQYRRNTRQPVTTTRYYLRGVGLAVQTTDDPLTLVHTKAQVLNEVEVPGP